MEQVTRTWVCQGKVPDRFSFECEYCGYCGGNYATADEAEVYAQLHAQLKAPEHRT